jgi:hypothetical protein
LGVKGTIKEEKKLLCKFHLPRSKNETNAFVGVESMKPLKPEIKLVVHGIWDVLNVHPNWVVLYVDVTNAFNTISKITIFKEVHVIGC